MISFLHLLYFAQGTNCTQKSYKVWVGPVAYLEFNFGQKVVKLKGGV